MIGWIEGIQNAIQYIENNLTEELSISEIAEKACLSAFHFQRIFSILCGFTVGEYIRSRRLSIAAEELSKADAKVIADNYIPWNEVPSGYETRVISDGTWVVFPCRGPLPKALQDVNTKIWSEWLPNCKEYKLTGNYSIETYYAPPSENSDHYYCEIWIPVVKA